MAGAGPLAAYAMTMSAAIAVAVTLQAETALGDIQAVDLREADIDQLLNAGVRLEAGAAYVRQLHIDAQGGLFALTLGVGAPAPWLDAVLPGRPVSLVAEEAVYSLSTGDIVVPATADELIARPSDAMPLARPVSPAEVAPSAMFGARVVGGPMPGEVRVVEVLGGREVERLRIQQVRFDREPGESRVLAADCAQFIPITRVLDFSACEA
ncbi:MAG: hypothetical protein ACOC05_00690 [Oceanicaulis sp.]